MPESGHTVGGAFLEFWQHNDGLTVFGYPISQELWEIGSDGAPRIVQYFQRARFELYPEAAFTPNVVQLSQLGRVALDRRPELSGYKAPAAALTLLGTASTGFPGSSGERRTNIERATMLFDGVVVDRGKEFSFIGNHDFSEQAGFVEGYGIIGGRLDRVMGGGLCQVSTTMFRAVANAGLQITRRVAHTYVVYFYENILGFDATVFTPDVDFRWRNNTPGSITISAIPDMVAERVTFDIYGTNDGRQITYTGPDVRNRVKPGRPIWQYDASLPRGSRVQMVHGRDGMDVTLVRNVTMPDGRVLLRDRFDTHYRPWDDFWVFGPGVTPPAGARII
jgi:vancomycin resistance protein YoaR